MRVAERFYQLRRARRGAFVADLLAEARQEAARLAPLNKTDRR